MLRFRALTSTNQFRCKREMHEMKEGTNEDEETTRFAEAIDECFWCFYNFFFVNAALICAHILCIDCHYLAAAVEMVLHSHQCKLQWHVHTEAHTECVASFSGQVKFLSQFCFQIHSGFVCVFFSASLLRYSYLVLSFCCSILFHRSIKKKNKRYLWTSAYIYFRKWKSLSLSLARWHPYKFISRRMRR